MAEVCVCVCVCVQARAHVCVCGCVCVRIHEGDEGTDHEDGKAHSATKEEKSDTDWEMR